MKLTNEQKGNNATIKTGVRVLQNKLIKLKEDIDQEEETIRINSRLKMEMSEASIIVSQKSLGVLNGMVKQLNTCINMLEGNLV